MQITQDKTCAAYALWDGEDTGNAHPAPSHHAAKIRARKRLNDAPKYWRGAMVGHVTDAGEFVPQYKIDRDFQYIGWLPM